MGELWQQGSRGRVVVAGELWQAIRVKGAEGGAASPSRSSRESRGKGKSDGTAQRRGGGAPSEDIQVKVILSLS